MQFLATLLVAAAVCLCGCGAPGAPQAPSLAIPKPVSDLQATRKGANVTLTWTAPTETTDGELIRKPGKMVLGRASTPGGPFQTVAQVDLEPTVKVVQRPRASARDDVSRIVADRAAPPFLLYHVIATSNRGRRSPASNEVSVAAVPTFAPPQNVTLGLEPRGVSISFELPQAPETPANLNSQFVFRVLRRQSENKAAAEPAVVAEVKPGQQTFPIIDTQIEWEKKYDYWVTPVTLWSRGAQKGEVEGEDSPTATILAHDTFPPAAPTGLQAVFSGLLEHPGIDLTWTPNTDEDLAGYNVYRRTTAGQPQKVNTELVKTPAFHDGAVAPGNQYWYSVSAVDLRGNESAKSGEAMESVPKQ
jgi:hypothetical protein